MEILKTKIAIMDSVLTNLPNSEIEIFASSAKHRNESSKCIKSKKTVVNG